MTPDISILIPTYRRPDLLKRCLLKLLAAIPAQHEKFEVLIGDDSRDVEMNREVVEKFRKEWKGNLRYFLHPESLGQQRNFNFLIESAQGRFIQFVHDDDFLLPGAGSVFLDAAKQQGDSPVPIKFGVHLVKMNEAVVRIQTGINVRPLTPVQAVRRLVSESSYVRFPAMFIPRRSYCEAGFFDLSRGYLADQAMWLKLAREHGLQERPECTVAYTVHEAAGTSTMFTQEFISNLNYLLREYVSFLSLDSKRENRLIGTFLWRFVIAGQLRAWHSKDWTALNSRLALNTLPELQGTPCPIKWQPLRIFLYFISWFRNSNKAVE